jgi:hypothetical protein
MFFRMVFDVSSNTSQGPWFLNPSSSAPPAFSTRNFDRSRHTYFLSTSCPASYHGWVEAIVSATICYDMGLRPMIPAFFTERIDDLDHMVMVCGKVAFLLLWVGLLHCLSSLVTACVQYHHRIRRATVRAFL